MAPQTLMPANYVIPCSCIYMHNETYWFGFLPASVACCSGPGQQSLNSSGREPGALVSEDRSTRCEMRVRGPEASAGGVRATLPRLFE